MKATQKTEQNLHYILPGSFPEVIRRECDLDETWVAVSAQEGKITVPKSNEFLAIHRSGL